VPESQGRLQRALERGLARTAEPQCLDRRRVRVAASRRVRVAPGRLHAEGGVELLVADPGPVDYLRGQPFRLAEQACRDLCRVDPVGARDPPGGRERIAGALSEAGEHLASLGHQGRDETLLGRLLGHAHAGADHAPRGTRMPGLVDEMADQRVGLLVKARGDRDRVGEVAQRPALRVQRLDVADQIVEGDREAVHASRLD
jgi:hypothetical protein